MISPRVRPLGLGIAQVLLLLCVPASVHAGSSGQLSGTVSDQNGIPLPGVHVAVLGATNRATDTDAAGAFAFADIPMETMSSRRS
jgi:hypothetical protein